VDRRSFLKTSTLTAGATLLPDVLGQAHTAQGQDLRMLPMNRGWRFSPRVVEGDTRQEFDDTAFMRVVIPHTNKVLPWQGFAVALLR
jgi:beta-galactosidase